MPPKPGHGNPHNPTDPSAPSSPSSPGLITLTLNPEQPAYGDTLTVGYTPASPVLSGYKMHFTVTSTAETQTDTSLEGPGQIIEDETKSVSTGTAAQGTTFQCSGGTEWSGGNAEGNVDLIAPAGNVVASAGFTIFG